MCGSATLTTLMSRMTISWLRHAAVSARAGRLLVAVITMSHRVPARGQRPLRGIRSRATRVRRVPELTSRLRAWRPRIYACGVVQASAVGVEGKLRELARRLEEEVDGLVE